MADATVVVDVMIDAVIGEIIDERELAQRLFA